MAFIPIDLTIRIRLFVAPPSATPPEGTFAPQPGSLAKWPQATVTHNMYARPNDFNFQAQHPGMVLQPQQPYPVEADVVRETKRTATHHHRTAEDSATAKQEPKS
ncbi:hypothetical protein BV898_00374 [Hypsibius exemplaris]|uniref:Uncharacterized protein n=1 Tax=Hypsibius exemplaris TaxID=2072580 RepID=A0A1W0XFJ9_HYPEX|nr:hypothetical protein BV898_00374 [Hypsibius exemplaris]